MANDNYIVFSPMCIVPVWCSCIISLLHFHGVLLRPQNKTLAYMLSVLISYLEFVHYLAVYWHFLGLSLTKVLSPADPLLTHDLIGTLTLSSADLWLTFSLLLTFDLFLTCHLLPSFKTPAAVCSWLSLGAFSSMCGHLKFQATSATWIAQVT